MKATAATLLVAGLALVQSPTLATAEAVVSQSVVGSYLAGRTAGRARDTESAADFFQQALTREPGNPTFVREAFVSESELGNWPASLALARELVKSDPANRLARAVLGLDAFIAGRYEDAETQFKQGNGGPIGELTSTLARSWTKVAAGKSKDALDLLDSLTQADWARYYRIYNRANISALAGMNDVAEKAFAELFAAEPGTLNVAVSYARFASSIGKQDLARQIMTQHIGADGNAHPDALLLAADLAKGVKQPLFIDDAKKGMGEVLHGIGEALTNDGVLDASTIYLQMALHVHPNNTLTLASLAGVQESMRRYDLAIDTYGRIAPNSPISFGIALRRAIALNQLERVDDAKTLLLGLVEQKPVVADPAVGRASLEADVLKLSKLDIGTKSEEVRKLQTYLAQLGYKLTSIDGAFGQSTADALRQLQKESKLPATGVLGKETRQLLLERLLAATPAKPAMEQMDDAKLYDVYIELGNILRSHERFEEAVGYYDKALALVKTPKKANWSQYYSRAVCNERLKRWTAAEADFLKAIELDPEQASTLNYLGYSYVDQGLNLEKALGMIEKAVRLRPDDGYIVDSLGWAYFKLGRFDDAVAQLERAVELKANDTVINDHLGDAYWRAGRTLEAKYQWSEAVTGKPSVDDLKRIETKLKDGLAAHADGSKAADAAPVADDTVKKQ